MRRSSRIAAGALTSTGIASFTLLALPRAFAQSPSFTLAWEAPEGCPSEAAVRAAVDGLLGGGVPPPVQVTARATVQRTTPGRWVVQLRTTRDGVPGERVVEAPSCSSLADATALIVALTVDPERVAARAAAPSGSSTLPPPEPTTSSTPPPSLAASDPSAANASPPSPRLTIPPPALPAPRTASSAASAKGSWNVAALVQVGGDLGTLPRLAADFGAGLALTVGQVRVEGYGAYLFPQPSNAATPPSIGTSLHLLVGGLRGCFFPIEGTIEAGGCAGLELGDLHGDGFGALHSAYATFTPTSAGSFWIAPTLDGRLTWRVNSSFGLVFDVGIAVPLRRDTFSVEDVPDPLFLHQASAVVGRATLGPEVRF